MTKDDKKYVVDICRILADKMDDSGKVAVEQVISAVEDLEEQVPQRTGHWREKKQSFSLVTGEEVTETFLECDQCQAYGPTEMLKFWNYCPKCGSRMKGVWVE